MQSVPSYVTPGNDVHNPFCDQYTAVFRFGQRPSVSDEIWSLQVSFPPLAIQHAIVERIQAGRAEIARLRADAERVRRAARVAIEALILGTLPVAEN